MYDLIAQCNSLKAGASVLRLDVLVEDDFGLGLVVVQSSNQQHPTFLCDIN